MKIVIIGDGALKGNEVIFGSWIESLKLAQKNDSNTYYYLFSRHFLEKKVLFRKFNQIFISFKRLRKNPTFLDLSISFQLIYILKRINPDVVHIYGTEFSHSWKAFLATFFLNYRNRTILTIQAVLNDLVKNYLNGIPFLTQFFPSLKDSIKLNSLFKEFLLFKIKSVLEIFYLKYFKFIAGRTKFDYNFFIKHKSKDGQYLLAYESLREKFFQQKIENKDISFNIFLSGSDSPRKGLHEILKEFKYLIKIFPNITLKVIGTEPKFGIKGFFLNDSYQNYISSLISKNRLKNNVKFLGYLNQEGFIKELLSSDIFIMPSSHENSPNSISEALILKIPVIAYNVGGISEILSYGGGIVVSNSKDMLLKIIEFYERKLILNFTEKQNPFIISGKDNNKRYTTMYENIIHRKI